MSNEDCIACAREYSWEEVLRNNIKDEHELKIILEHIARAETMLEMQREENRKIKNENFALSREIAMLVNKLIYATDLENEHEFSRYYEHTMCRLKKDVKGPQLSIIPPTKKGDK